MKEHKIVSVESEMHKNSLDEAINERIEAELASAELREMLSELRTKFEKEIRMLDCKLLKVQEENHEAISKEKDFFGKENESLRAQIAQLKETVMALKTEVQNLQNMKEILVDKLEIKEISLLDLKEEMTTLKKIRDKLEKDMKEKAAAEQIADKKAEHMVKELRMQLRAEVFHVKELEAALKATRDELYMLQNSEPVSDLSNEFRETSQSVFSDFSKRTGEDSKLERNQTSFLPYAGENIYPNLETTPSEGIIMERFIKLQEQNFLLREEIIALQEQLKEYQTRIQSLS